ncbi:MAG: hypothetical protein ACK5O8_14365 [Pirellula sp.]
MTRWTGEPTGALAFGIYCFAIGCESRRKEADGLLIPESRITKQVGGIGRDPKRLLG